MLAAVKKEEGRRRTVVTIHRGPTTEEALAWRVRDALAAHPMLSGPTARIRVGVDRDGVTLSGWIADSELGQTAVRLAMRAAGRRAVYVQLRTDRCLGA